MTLVRRFGAIAVFSVMVLLVSAAPAAGTAGPDAMSFGAGLEAGKGSGALRAPLGQVADNLDDPTGSDAAAEASQMAALVAVMNWQGGQGPANLERVSAMPVQNLTLKPEFVVDARVERAAAVFAAVAVAEAAVAEVVTETEAALSAQATAGAQAASDAATAAALRSAEEAEAAANREAQAVAATATREAQAAAAEANKRQFSTRVSLLVMALIVLAGGVLGLRLWRNRKEPFVLKAIPVNVTANAHV